MQFSAKGVCIPRKISLDEAVKSFGILDFTVLLKNVDQIIEESEFCWNMTKMIPRFIEYCCCIQNSIQSVENIHVISTLFGKILSYLCLLQVFGEDLRMAKLQNQNTGSIYSSNAMEDDVETFFSHERSFEVSIDLSYSMCDGNQAALFSWNHKSTVQSGISDVLNQLLVGQDSTKWGLVDILYRPDQIAELVVLKIAPGKSIPWHVHRIMKETEICLDAGLLCQNMPINSLSDSFRLWGNEEPHSYDNPCENWKLVLCIDQPQFIHSDEVEFSSSDFKSDSQKHFLLFNTLQNFLWSSMFAHSCSFTFPGGIFSENQEIMMNFGSKSNQNFPNAVCICIVVIGTTPSENELLLVQHKNRGWELPGGKVELGEKVEDALYRELFEEAGLDRDTIFSACHSDSNLISIGQYFISSKNEKTLHIKSVYGIKLIRRPELSKEFFNETENCRFFNLQTILRGELPESSSPLIKDLIFQISIRLSHI
jgi:8-oxo-dGTP pyrophosphatase MutT (NUDIX family)